MKKVNIIREINHLKLNKIRVAEIGPTDGDLIKKVNMTNYLKTCYVNSTALPSGIPRNGDYRYYNDKENKICVLFTTYFIFDESSNNQEIEIKKETIIIKIYISNAEFMNGILIQVFIYYFKSNYRGEWDHKNGIYFTNCKEFNEFPLVKDLSKLSGISIINEPKTS